MAVEVCTATLRPAPSRESTNQAVWCRRNPAGNGVPQPQSYLRLVWHGDENATFMAESHIKHSLVLAAKGPTQSPSTLNPQIPIMPKPIALKTLKSHRQRTNSHKSRLAKVEYRACSSRIGCWGADISGCSYQHRCAHIANDY